MKVVRTVMICFFIFFMWINSLGFEIYANELPVLAVSTSEFDVVVSWSIVPGATGYSLFYAPYPTASPISSVDMELLNSITVSLWQGASYYIAVKAYNDGGMGNFSNIEHFTINAISDFSVPRANVTIDGNRSDWDSLEPIFIDAVNDENPEADFDGMDLYEFYLSRDDEFLYLMATLYDGNPNPAAQYTFEMVPDAYGSGKTGDYLAVAWYRDGAWSSSVNVRDQSNLNVQYPSDYVSIGEDFIEWKVNLSDIPFVNDRYVWVYIHNYTPIFYPVSDDKRTGIRIHLE